MRAKRKDVIKALRVQLHPGAVDASEGILERMGFLEGDELSPRQAAALLYVAALTQDGNRTRAALSVPRQFSPIKGVLVYLEQVLSDAKRADAVKRVTGDRATGELVISEGVQVHEFAGQFLRRKADPMELRTTVLKEIASLFAGEVREVEVVSNVQVRGGAAGWSPVIERYKRR